MLGVCDWIFRSTDPEKALFHSNQTTSKKRSTFWNLEASPSARQWSTQVLRLAARLLDGLASVVSAKLGSK